MLLAMDLLVLNALDGDWDAWWLSGSTLPWSPDLAWNSVLPVASLETLGGYESTSPAISAEMENRGWILGSPLISLSIIHHESHLVSWKSLYYEY